jgi:maleylacetoacetate isomerase
MEILLYSYWRSSCSWRVRWALNIKGIPYRTINVNLLKNEQNSVEYLKINAGGRVPTLIVEGRPLSGSLAIIEWLDENWVLNPLLPRDPWAKAQVREMAHIIAMDTQPIQNISVLKRHSDLDDEKKAWARDFNRIGLRTFDRLVAKYSTSEKYSFGDQLSLADLCLVPQCYNAMRFDIDLEVEFPRLASIYSYCLSLRTCFNAAPDQQQVAP